MVSTINNIELIDLTSSPSPMDNTIFDLEAEIVRGAEQMLAQQAKERQAREKNQQAKKEQHQIWKESELVAQQAREKRKRKKPTKTAMINWIIT